MKRSILQEVVLLLPLLLLPTIAFLPAFAPQGQDPTLTPTAGAVIVATAEGRGVQIYACTAQSSSYTWTLQGPEAVLYATSGEKRLGTHSQGPTWTWSDGSAITGKMLAQMPSPHAGSVPWLLLQVQPVGAGKGVLTPVTLVRRSDTEGGAAPALGCDAGHAGTAVRVPYKATYSFYTVTESPAAP